VRQGWYNARREPDSRRVQ